MHRLSQGKDTVEILNIHNKSSPKMHNFSGHPVNN